MLTQEINSKEWHFLINACNEHHYFVVEILFDPTKTSSSVFKEVSVYDSLLGGHSNPTKVQKQSGVGEFLIKFQTFACEFILYDEDDLLNQTYCGLKADKYAIMKNANFLPCPKQENVYDCSLFGLATLLHLVSGKKINSLVYQQEHISKFRSSLYKILSSENLDPDPRKHLSRHVFSFFFPEFFDQEYGSCNKNDSHYQYLLAIAADDGAASSKTNDVHDDESGFCKPATDYVDEIFKKMFVTVPKSYADFDEIDKAIKAYEKATGNLLLIPRSEIGKARE